MKTYKYTHCATCSYSQFDTPCPEGCTGNFYIDAREVSSDANLATAKLLAHQTIVEYQMHHVDGTPSVTTVGWVPLSQTPNPKMAYGWVCPKCGAVMSPTQVCCVNCGGRVNKEQVMEEQAIREIIREEIIRAVHIWQEHCADMIEAVTNKDHTILYGYKPASLDEKIEFFVEKMRK